MVTTRNRQQQQAEGTPPAARLPAADGEPSPATPVDQPANGRAPLPLKSALKTQRRHGGGHAGEGGSGDECTPGGAALLKKTVRIHSSGNMVREFQASHTTDDLQQGSDEEGQGTPQSGPLRRPAPRRGSGQPRHRHLGPIASRDARRGTRRGGSSAGLDGASLGVLFTLSWMVASSALIFVNKTLMVDLGFHFPFALTAMGQAAATLLAWLASALGVAPLRPAPAWGGVLRKLLPISLSFAASLFLGNAAYLGLSVAFINIIKAATPLVTLAVGLALGLERFSRLSAAATGLIALGTAISTSSEASSGHFDWLSFIAFALSVLFEGVRVVLTEKLLGQAKYNVMEALAYLGPFTAAFLAAGAYAFEWHQGLSTQGVRLLRERPYDFALAAVVSFLVNLFCYLAIKHVTATSFKVAGCLKNVLVVWGGILQGDVVTRQELQASGYAISLAGFLLFSAAKLRGAAGLGRSGDSGSPRKKAQ